MHTEYFVPLGAAALPRHGFSGTLRVHAGSIAHARGDCLGLPSAEAGFTAAFFTHGEHLVPVVRGLVDAGRVALILSPGRVWSEPGVDVGTWHITDDGRYCRTWHTWDNGLARCYRVSHARDRLHLDVDGRFGRFAAPRVPGNVLRRN